MRSIQHLPNELLSSILSRLEDFEDWTNFRLICRACEPVPIPLLFRRIRLSRLKWDKDVFEQIASHPHLAQHVQELVWYELQLEAWIDQSSIQSLLEDDYHESMRQFLTDAIHDPELFWIPRSEPSSNCTNTQQIINDYRPRFFQFLERLPNLRTFASSPIRGDREILYRDYPLTIDLFLLQLDCKTVGHSEGFLEFLVPAMERPASTVIDLRLAERRIYISLLFQPVSLTLNGDVFRALTSIDLDLNCTLQTVSTDTGDIVKDNTKVFAECLRSAKGLRRLALRFDDIRCHYPKTSDLVPPHLYPKSRHVLCSYSPLILDGLVSESYWPQLASVHLQHASWFCNSSFSEFLGNHAATLKSLHLEDCIVRRRDLLTLRSLNLFQLSSLEITCSDEDCMVEEEEGQGLLLAYLNHATALYHTNYGEISVVHSSSVFVTRKEEEDEENEEEDEEEREENETVESWR